MCCYHLCILTIHNLLVFFPYREISLFWFSSGFPFVSLPASQFHILQSIKHIFAPEFCLKCAFPPSPTELSLINFRTE